MNPFTDVTLGLLVFCIGVTFQFLYDSAHKGESRMPLGVRAASVLMWAILSFLFWCVINHVQKESETITIYIGDYPLTVSMLL